MHPFLEKNLISTKEASELSGYNSDYLARLCKSNKILGRQIGRTWLVDKSSLQQFISVQGERKIDRARAQARAREQEYRSAQLPINKVKERLTVFSEGAPVIRLSRGTGILAALVALLVLGTSAYAAETTAIPNVVNEVALVANQIRGGLTPIIDAQLIAINNKITAAQLASGTAQIDASTEIAGATISAPVLGSLELHQPNLALVTVPAEQNSQLALQISNSPLSIPTLTQSVNFGMLARQAFFSFVNLPHEAIALDVDVAYATPNLADSSSRAIVTAIGTLGNNLAVLTAQVPSASVALAQDTQTATIAFGEESAREFFGAEYALGQQFVAGTNIALGSEMTALQGGGNVVYQSYQGVVALAPPVQLFVALLGNTLHTPVASMEDYALGILGSGALAVNHFGASLGANSLATAVAANTAEPLSVGENVALSTYETINGLFQSTTDSLASIFAPLPIVVLPELAGTVATSSPRVATATTVVTGPTYRSYSTVVQGVSQAELDQSLAGLKSDLLTQMVALTTPIEQQTTTNEGAIQQVNVIQSLTDLILHAPTIDGAQITDSNFSGGSISAGSGSFTSLSAGTTTLSGSINATAYYLNGIPFVGGGGSDGIFATSSDLLYPLLNSSTLVLGGTSTSTAGTIFEAHGNAFISGVLALGNALGITSGGTGTSTAPTYGQLLLGDANGNYELVATSSLGITGGGGGTWGSITGTLSNQTDLQNALNAKFNLADWYATTSAPQLTTLSHLSLPLSQTTGVLGVASGGTGTSTGGVTNGVEYYNGTTLTNGTALTWNPTTGLFGITGNASSTQLTTTGATYLATSGGNVGIGTTSPGTLLSIGNTTGWNFSATGTTTESGAAGINLTAGCFAVNGLCVGASGGSGTVGSGTTGQFPYYAANGTTLTATSSLSISAAGNIGIGTTSPYAILSVMAGTDYGSHAAGTIFAVGSSTAGTATSTLFDIQSNGYVGIGTTSPNAELAIAGTGGAETYIVNNWDAGKGTWINLSTDGPSGIGSGGPGINTWIGYSSSNSAYFSNALSGDITYRNALGKRLLFGIDNGSGTNAATEIITNAAVAIAGTLSTTGTSTFATSGGSVGIGTTTPGALLGVQGSGDFAGNLTAQNITATGTLAANSLSLSNALSIANGGTGITTYNTGDILYADSTNHLTTLPIGSTGQVLKISGGVPGWGTDLTSGGGGSDGIFATSSDLIYPLNSIQALVIGGTSTSTAGTIFEAHGNAYISGTLALGNALGITSGGTGWSNVVANTILLGNGTGSFATTSAGTNGQVLGLVGGIPTWVATTTLANISGTLAVGSGGTGQTTFSSSQLLYGNGTNALTSVATSSFATSGEFSYSGTLGSLVGGAGGSLSLATNGVGLTKLAQIAGNTILGNSTGATGNITAFATSSLGIALSDTTGTLAVGRGGTGTSTAPTYGQLLLGDANGNYELVATSSLGITSGVSSVSNSDSSLTISPTSGAVIASLNLTHPNTFTALQQFNGNASSTELTTTGATYLASGGASNVGIGTTSPYATLSVMAGDDYASHPTGTIFAVGSSTAGTATTTLFSVNTTGAVVLNTLSNNPGVFFGPSGSWTLAYANASGAYFQNALAGDLIVRTGQNDRISLGPNNSTGNNTAMEIISNSGVAIAGTLSSTGATNLATGSGDVGIGTTSPYATLSVMAGDDYASHAASTLFAIGSSTAGTATSTLFNILSSGKIGIGTTSPGTLLGVQGSGDFAGNLTAQNITATGTLAANSLSLTSALTVPNGGTGWSNVVANAILLGNGTGSFATTSAGTNGQVLGLVGGIPTWVATTTLANISGTLAVGSGGTGITTYNTGDILYADSTNHLTTLPIGSTGQVLKISGGVPGWGTDLTSGGGGSDGIFATSSDLIYPLNSIQALVIGGTSTSTAGTIFEAHGNAYISGTLALGNALGITSGGTGTSTAPTYGQLLLGDANGNYELVATSSLGITSGVSSVSNSDSSLTISPTSGAVIASLNLTHPNTFTALQQFNGNASTTGISALYASSTNAFFGNLSVGTLSGLLKGTAGVVSAAVAGTDYLAPSSLSATYPLQYSANNFSLAFGTSTSNTWGGTQTFTNSPILGTLSGLIYGNAGTLATAATSSFATSGEFSYSGTLGSLVGGAGGSLSLATNGVGLTKLAQIAGNTILGNSTGATGNITAFATSSLGIALSDTTGTLAVGRGGTGQTTFSSSQLLYGNGTNALTSVATSSASNGSGISLGGTGALVGAGGLTITNTGLLSLQQLGGGSAQTGAITFATSSQSTNGQTVGLNITNSSGAFTFAPTISGTLGVGGGGTGQTTFSSSQLLYGNGANALTGVATSSVSSGTGISFSGTAGALVGGSSLTITNNGLLSLQQLGGGSAQTGAITFATSSSATTGLTIAENITNTAGAFTFAPTLSGTLAVGSGGTGTSTGGVTNGVEYYNGSTLTNGTALTWNPSTALFGITGNASSTELTTTGATYLATTGGNVGIGTTSPGTLLSIGNTTGWNFSATGTTTESGAAGINLTAGCFAVNGLCVGASGGSGTVGSGTTGQFPYYAANGTTLTATSSLSISAAGNIGIGTTSPSALLSIATPVNSNGSLARLFNVSSSTAGTATSTLFSVLSNGNVGVGTSSPYEIFSVQNTDGTSTGSLTFQSSINGPNGAGGLFINGGTDAGGGFADGFTFTGGYVTGGIATGGSFNVTAGASYGSNGTAGPINLTAGNGLTDGGIVTLTGGNATSTGSGGNIVLNPGTGPTASASGNILLAETNGFVGIGTTSPYATLSVMAGDDYASHAASTLFAIGSSTAGTATSTLFNILSSGKIGIGTTSPGTLLGVQGSGDFAGNLTAQNITATGTLAANSLSLTSALTVPNGGTGWSNVVANAILLGNGTGSFATTSAGTNGQVLGLVGGIPTWVATTTLANISGTLAVGSGGTGQTTFSSSQLLYGNGTNALTSVATSSFATSGEFSYSGTLGSLVGGAGGSLSLATNGVGLTKLAQIAGNTILGNSTGATGNITAFATSSLGIALSDTTGTLAVGRGGTGQTTFSSSQLLYGNGTNALTSVATSSASNGSGISLGGTGALVGAGGLTITNTGLLSLQQLGGGSAQTGAITFATSSQSTNGQTVGLNITNSSGAFTFAPTISGTLGVGGGGTGQTTFSSSQLLYGNGANALTGVATSSVSSGTGISFSGTAGALVGGSSLTITNNGLLSLQQLGGGSAQTGAITFATSSSATTGLTTSLAITNSSGAFSFAPTLSGILTVPNGGTGWSNVVANAILLGNGTGSFATTSAGTNGQVLGLVGGIPTWVATTTLANISGTLAVGSGGTGQTTFSSSQLLYGNGTNALTSVATSSVSSGTGISFSGTAGALVGGSSLTITNNGVISNSCPGGFLSCSGTNPSTFTLGTLGLGNGGTATTTFYAGGVVFSDGSKLTQAASASSLFWNNTNNHLGIGTTTPVGILSLQTATNQTSAFSLANAIGSTTLSADTIDTNGNIFSVATTSGTDYFDVQAVGNIALSIGTYASCSSLTTNSNGVIQCSVSDERLKENVTPLADNAGLSAIDALNPVSFNYIDPTRPQGLQYGLIAQQVQQILPALVATSSPTALTPDGTLTVNYDGLIAPLIRAVQELDARTASLASVATTSASSTGAASPITVSGNNVGIDVVPNAATLQIAGNVLANEYDAPLVTGSSFNFGSSTLAATIPASVLTAGGSVDLYKLATYNLSGITLLAAQVQSNELELSSLEDRVAKLESGAVGTATSTNPFSTSTLASAFNALGAYISQGIAQFGTLVADQFVAATNSAGTSSAGSGTILAGNTTVLVSNAYAHTSSKIFVTFTSAVPSGWYLTDKEEGSFRVVLSATSTADTTFDYFIVETQGQIATSTPEQSGTEAGGNTGSGSPPVITLLGANPVNLSPGDSYADPGESVTDATDGTDPLTYFVNGVAVTDLAANIDTSSAQTYTIIYTATDSDGNTASAERTVVVSGPNDGSSGDNSGGTGTSTPSTAPPTVTLNGNAAMQITQGSTWTDPGATAVDSTGADISSSIVESGSVDPATINTYTLTYTATDSTGQTGSASRVVGVVAPSSGTGSSTPPGN